MSINFTGNGEFAVYVSDLEQARKFYHGTLGLAELPEMEGCLGFDAGSFRIFVMLGRQPKSFVPSYDADSSKAEVRDYLLSHGCTVSETGNEAGYFTDPFGMVFDIVAKG